MTDLTATQKTILEAAIGHLNGSIHPLPDHLKGGAARKVIESLLRKGLIEEDGPETWRINEAGFRAIGLELPQEEAQVEAAADFEADVAAAEAALAETKPRRTRENSKQAQVIEMLKRPEGATAAQIAEVTGWQNHYADARIMPNRGGNPLCRAVLAEIGAA